MNRRYGRPAPSNQESLVRPFHHPQGHLLGPKKSHVNLDWTRKVTIPLKSVHLFNNIIFFDEIRELFCRSRWAGIGEVREGEVGREVCIVDATTHEGGIAQDEDPTQEDGN